MVIFVKKFIERLIPNEKSTIHPFITFIGYVLNASFCLCRRKYIRPTPSMPTPLMTRQKSGQTTANTSMQCHMICLQVYCLTGLISRLLRPHLIFRALSSRYLDRQLLSSPTFHHLTLSCNMPAICRSLAAILPTLTQQLLQACQEPTAT